MDGERNPGHGGKCGKPMYDENNIVETNMLDPNPMASESERVFLDYVRVL